MFWQAEQREHILECSGIALKNFLKWDPQEEGMFSWIENSSRTPSSLQFWTQSTIQIENSTLQGSGGTVLLIMQIMKRNNKILCCLTAVNKILKSGRQKYLIFWLYRRLLIWPTTHMQASQKHLLVLWKNTEVQTSPWPTQICIEDCTKIVLFWQVIQWGFFSKNTTNSNRDAKINYAT